MALFNLDISKLSSNATVQVVVSVAIIGGAILTTNYLINKGDSKKLDSISETVTHINIEQSFQAEAVAELKEGQDDLVDSVKRLESKMDVIQVEQDVHHKAINDLGWAISNRDEFTPDQMEEILDRMLKKNTELTVLGSEPTTPN